MGAKVKYLDFLGMERQGTVVAILPTNDDDCDIIVFIKDDIDEYNDQTYVDPVGNMCYYAEVRKANEVEPIEGELKW